MPLALRLFGLALAVGSLAVGCSGMAPQAPRIIFSSRSTHSPSAAHLSCNGGRVAQLLRGGSWINNPHNARAAFRNSNHPDNVNTNVGVRPGCFSPPAPFTVRAVGRDSSGSARRVQTRSGDRRFGARSVQQRPTAPWPKTWELWWVFCLGDPVVHGEGVASHVWRSPLRGLIPSALRSARKQPTLLITGRTPIHLQQPLKDQVTIHGAEFTIRLPLQAGLLQAGVAAREMGDIHGHLCSAGVSLLWIWRR